MAKIHICTRCNHSFPVEPGRNSCPTCEAVFEFDQSTTRRVHWYRWQDVLRPGGSDQRKESLAPEILERMVDAYECWTDPQYGDLPEVHDLRARSIHNAREEVEVAIAAFVDRFGNKTARAS